MKIKLWVVAISIFLGCVLPSAGSASSQNIAGVWQGTMQVPGVGLRRIMTLTKGRTGVWNATIISIDETDVPMVINSLTLNGQMLKFRVDMNTSEWPDFHRTYEGRLNAAGTLISGSWTSALGAKYVLNFQRATKATAWHLQLPKKTELVAVEHGVRVEVLDWGGSGRALMLLAGLGNSAHVFSKFAPKLALKYHVYSMSRRGFGRSSTPAFTDENYSATRLGDDVVAVVDALKLDKPILAGHSIAGEELSSVASRYPNKVAGLIYLDAGYPYAYYDSSHGDIGVDANEVRAKLRQLVFVAPSKQIQLINDLLQTDLPALERSLRQQQKDSQAIASASGGPQNQADSPIPPLGQAIILGQRKYTAIHVPVLAIFAVPKDPDPQMSRDPAALAAVEVNNREDIAQVDAFERGIPSARIVRLPHANHYVFLSNEEQVLKEINVFISSLP